jgi:eukaryotic-like serine/threonine-protein kinase
MEDQLRTELSPDLEIIRRVGRGSHATVYLAREPALKRLVAVKVLRPDLAGDLVLPRRFEREAQSAASIAHPNVTPIYRVGRLHSGVPYIVMEYIDGRTLADTLAAGGPLPLEKAHTVLASIASALAAAHAHGIVHRDVRPGNVFVEASTGRAVLADFGIAGLVESGDSTSTRLTAVGHRLGDMRYLSPEQVNGEPATVQSDVYSFGILAYETLTGRGPYEASNAQQIMVAHVRQEPRPLADLRPDIDPGMAAIIQRCLNKDPNHRPRSEELAAQLAAPEASTAEPVPTGFFAELKRRRVYQVAAGYLLVGSGLVEMANNFFPPLHIGEWALTVLAVLVVAGFPVALILSWIYDITATGIQRTTGGGDAAALPLRTRIVPWLALAGSVVLAAAIVWLVMHRH